MDTSSDAIKVPVEMDALPNEMIVSIFNHLGVRTSMNARQVSKRWKLCIDDMKFKKLVLRLPGYIQTHWWYHSYRPIDRDDIIPRIYFSECLKLIPLNLEHVTCLILDTPIFYEDATILNRFKHLEHLEFSNLIFQEVGSPMIKLPHLKVLKIASGAHNYDGSTIDAPSLEILSCSKGIRGLVFPHPKSVKHLQIDDIQHDLRAFENVEVFCCFRPESVNANLLQQLE